MIIKRDENSYTGLRFTFEAVAQKKCFVLRREHKEKLPEECRFAHMLGIHETYVEDEEVILDDFFKANKLYCEWLRIY